MGQEIDAAELEVRNFLNHMTVLVDEASPEALAELYCEDGVWESEVTTVSGRAAILELLRGNRKSGHAGPGSRTRHMLSNVTVSVEHDGQAATAHAYWTLMHTASSEPKVTRAGDYSFRLRKEPTGWRVAYRRVGFFGADR